MYEQIEVSISGVSPLLMHSNQGVSRFNPITREIKALTGKRTKKTDADEILISKLEWLNGLYLNQTPEIEISGETVNILGNPHVVMPDRCIEAMLCAAATQVKRGMKKDFRAGCFVPEEKSPLIYEPNIPVSEMVEDQRFIHQQVLRVQTSSIMRTRPVFVNWGVDFTIQFMPSIVNVRDIKSALETAGTLVGLCDFRPKYGRFDVIKFDHIK